MAGQYFDAVLDDNMQPVYNGTPEQTYKWLSGSAEHFTNTYQVCRGKDMRLFEIADYLREHRFRKVLEMVRDAIEAGPENNVEVTRIAMRIVEPETGRRNQNDRFLSPVLSLLREAVDIGDPNAHACETASKIVDLFK